MDELYKAEFDAKQNARVKSVTRKIATDATDGGRRMVAREMEDGRESDGRG